MKEFRVTILLAVVLAIQTVKCASYSAEGPTPYDSPSEFLEPSNATDSEEPTSNEDFKAPDQENPQLQEIRSKRSPQSANPIGKLIGVVRNGITKISSILKPKDPRIIGGSPVMGFKQMMHKF